MTDFEAEIARVIDVLAVRCVVDGDRMPEVHLLAAPGREVGDIAADVHSLAVLRGVGLELGDIHVVQLQPTDEPAPEPEPGTEVGATSNGTAEDAIDLRTSTTSGRERRVEIDSVMIVNGDGATRAVATARLGMRTATGTASFVPAAAALRRGVAEATLSALLELVDSSAVGEIAVDNAVAFPLPPHEVAVVTLAVVSGITEQTLVGAVLVGGAGANDAIARAVLDATNRRLVARALPPSA